MWNWLDCYLPGRQPYGVCCAPGAIFLRCVYCGRRSQGWSIEAKPQTPTIARSTPPPVGVAPVSSAAVTSHVRPLGPAAS